MPTTNPAALPAEVLREARQRLADDPANDERRSAIFARIDAALHIAEAFPEIVAAAQNALKEMCHTVAPRNSFTDAVDALDAALARLP